MGELPTHSYCSLTPPGCLLCSNSLGRDDSALGAPAPSRHRRAELARGAGKVPARPGHGCGLVLAVDQQFLVVLPERFGVLRWGIASATVDEDAGVVAV